MDLEPCDPLRQGSIVPHWQLPFLGLQAFPTELTAFEIGYFVTFTATVRAAIFSRYGDHHRLAAAMQIGCIKMDRASVGRLRYVAHRGAEVSRYRTGDRHT